eukprot:SAG22_NODE_1110_length_5538_cov_3.596433_1_plen_49_part_00
MMHTYLKDNGYDGTIIRDQDADDDCEGAEEVVECETAEQGNLHSSEWN